MEISVKQIESLLNRQKELVIEKLLNSTSYYNSENTAGCSKTLPIDKDKFRELGNKTDFPDDIKVLKNYNVV